MPQAGTNPKAMVKKAARLGVIIDANKLFYAASNPEMPGVVERLGAIDFSFDLIGSFSNNDAESIEGIQKALSKLFREYDIGDVRLVFPPVFECWSMIPRSVHDVEEEQAQYLKILIPDSTPDEISSSWFSCSNRDFKMLSIRKKSHLYSVLRPFDGLVNCSLVSDFEIGNLWMSHHHFMGSFLTISSYDGVLCISSYLLGKLRAATYFHFDDLQDLPYHWMQYASHLPWIDGLHEQIIVYGNQTGDVINMLKPCWDHSSEIQVMNTFRKMNLLSDEETFSFPLERAFPAAMLAVG